MIKKKTIGETSYKQTAFGIIPRTKLIPLEIEGIKKAWDFVINKIHDKDAKITVDFIKEAHRIGFGWIFPEHGGKFRVIDVNVSKHTPPKYYLIPQMMENFVKDLNTRIAHLPTIEQPKFLDEIVTILAWAHHKFLWIHPFTDYNGRIGRLLNNIILLSLNLPPIELKVETTASRKKYVNALGEADNGNYKNLEQIIKSAINEAVLDIKKRSL